MAKYVKTGGRDAFPLETDEGIPVGILLAYGDDWAIWAILDDVPDELIKGYVYKDFARSSYAPFVLLARVKRDGKELVVPMADVRDTDEVLEDHIWPV